MKLRKMIIVLYLCLMFKNQLFARNIETEVNLREGCRRAMAGKYLKAYDAREQADKYLEVLKEKKIELTKELKKAEKEYRRRKNAVKKKEYNASRVEKEFAARVKVDGLKQRIEELQPLLERAKADLKLYTKREAELRVKLNPVFKVRRIPDRPKLGYPFKVEYHSSCSKYQYLCALPKKQAIQLRGLLEHETPSVCRKYASFSRQ